MQFATGDAVPDTKGSTATKLAEKKREVTKALKDMQAKTAHGALQQMMLQHFRDTANHLSFYTLPTEVAVTLPIKQMTRASTSMLSVKGKPALPEGTLPLEDVSHTLPLADRPGQIKDAPSLHPCLGPLELDSQDIPVFDDDDEAKPLKEDELDLNQLVEFCQHDGIIVFKVADKQPHLKKRPLHSVDNIISSYVAIRLYKIKYRSADGGLWVTPTSNIEVPLVQFFVGKESKPLMDHMWCWRLDQGSDDPKDASFCLKSFGRVFQQRVACPLTLSTVDIKRNIKPTHFELYLEASSKGWLWKTWSGKSGDLKRLAINLDPLAETKTFYNGTYNYLLCLVTLPAIAEKLSNKSVLMHGQLETYYATAFQLAQESRFAELDALRPDQSADFYRAYLLAPFSQCVCVMLKCI